ncbi:zf-CCHC domain-containing protein [Tanacetum coccineum]
MEKSFLNGIGLIEKETSGQSCLNYANTSKVNDGHGDNNDSIVTNAKRSDANIVVPKSVLAAKIHDMERQMLDGKLVLVDNEGVPLKPMFETYVKSKDIDLWHVIVYGDYIPTIKIKDTGKEEIIRYEKFEEIHKKMLSKNDEAKMILYNALPKKEYERIFMRKTAKDICNSLIITHQGNKQVKDNKIELFVQKYDEFTISDDETIDCAFARFNTILTSLKAPGESFSSQYKDLSTLPLDELIGNLKVYEVALEKDSEVSKNKKKKYKSLAHKAKKQSSDEEASCSDSDDEEYAMANSRKAKEEKKRKEERRCFNCGDLNHFISDCPKHSFNDQKAFVGGCWSDSDEEDNSTKDEICLMTLDNNEIESPSLKLSKFENSSHFLQEMIENQRSQKDKKGLGFTEDGALTSEVKIGKVGQESGKTPIVEPTEPVPSVREPASSNEGNRPPTEVRLKAKLEPVEWIKDSGCSRHMTGNKDLFSTYKAINGGNVVFGCNTKSKIIGKCTITHNSLTIHDVSRVENLSFKLLSIGQICDKKCKVLFSETGSEILKDDITIERGIRKNGLYVMKMGNSHKDNLCLVLIDDTLALWHRRLGHANMRLI